MILCYLQSLQKSNMFACNGHILNFLSYIISSPELKAQITFSDHILSGACLSVQL